MLQNKHDIRTKRTHQQIRDALIDLIFEKHFDNITVSDITNRAMINRSTFYRYYQDKYDVVLKIFEDAMERLKKDLGPPKESLKNLNEDQRSDPWVKLFDHFAENNRLYLAMLDDSCNIWFMSRLRSNIISMLREREKLRSSFLVSDKDCSPEIQEMAFLFTANALIGTIDWWLKSNCTPDSEKMSYLFRAYFKNGYVGMLNKD
ncbi:TetR/AcrR family transcriptional regulator [Clostridium beijerinckii]|uniref:AcrR family transcriptional regulator n=1 Tax=Clostridium beijerinckii TaxID=1520 RepID=A0AAE5HBI5_CLOBE|nr:TetR/AcrR family transcriptional regulator [Clostridium beijerinckii]NSB17534.1 AcrR family transcriptional regulator [Clostridium beijerinckii]OOM31624.1 bacterial regulatory protein, tetR family [Clostridium beijerinckii]